MNLSCKQDCFHTFEKRLNNLLFCTQGDREVIAKINFKIFTGNPCFQKEKSTVVWSIFYNLLCFFDGWEEGKMFF